MPRVRFLPANYECDVPVGNRMVDITDEHPDARVPYSCRSASCGTCHTEVLVGIELFTPAEPEEQELLDLLGGGKTSRLACQAAVRPGPGLIRLKSHLG
jgi:ferredoxin